MSSILPFGPAGQLNAGKKLLGWRVTLRGLAVTVAGLVLNFPHFGQRRDTLPLYHLIHVAAALPLIALILGYIDMATLGTEGALEGMSHGRTPAGRSRIMTCGTGNGWLRGGRPEPMTRSDVDRTPRP